MRLSQPSSSSTPPTAVLALADGTILQGQGIGAPRTAVAELCFNTAMTGYQEILTDPSYAGQLVTFTFPHIGNVGINDEDLEYASLQGMHGAVGVILRMDITPHSNYRAQQGLANWMTTRNMVGICGIDTRALTTYIRQNGMPHAALCHNPAGDFDHDALVALAQSFRGLEGQDLAQSTATATTFDSEQKDWEWPDGFDTHPQCTSTTARPVVVVMDFGVKKNILRRLSSAGCKVKVVPGNTGFDAIMALQPQGVVVSNGPGDPAATGVYAVPVLRQLIEKKLPILGICLGHQMLALAIGAKTQKMRQGHHGANHPVKDLTTGKVEIVSMNHGFSVDADTLPAYATPTYRSLFDGTNAGFSLTNAPVFSVQHHPEASPGPQDNFHIFERFVQTL